MLTEYSFQPPYNLPELTSQCPDFQDLVNWLAYQKLPADDTTARKILMQADQFAWLPETGLLHFYTPRQKSKTKQNAVTKQLCIPTCLLQTLLESYHDKLAHCGSSRLFLALREKYFHPKLFNIVNEYCRTCTQCQSVSRPPNLRKAPMCNWNLPNVLFDSWYLDFLGPFPPDANGNQYLLIAVDFLSSWPVAVPTKSTDAETVAEILYKKLFCEYGLPSRLIVDRGQGFMSKTVSNLSALCGIKIVPISAYAHWQNIVEKMNSTILKARRIHCADSQNKWTDKIESILMAYRAVPNVSRKYSPFFLAYGVEMKTAFDTSVTDSLYSSGDLDAYVYNLLEQIELIRKLAFENLQTAHQRAKFFYDETAKYPTFKVGDKVLVYDPTNKVGSSSKLKKEMG